jgi:uncharacterized repeat protein (TIGR01451 family)
MKNFILSLIAFVAVITLLPSSAQAQYGQPAPVQTILIDKMVAKPYIQTKGGVVDTQYVDNLTPSDPRFSPGQEVMFKLKVKNTSGVTLNNVTVKDYVPAYIDPVEGPGTYDSTSRVIAWDAGSFAPGEEKTYFIKMRLLSQDKMPANKGLFCLTNKGQVYNGYASDDDSAQFCVEKMVVATTKGGLVTTTPKSGPEAGILLLGAQGILMGVGYDLKKLAEQS